MMTNKFLLKPKEYGYFQEILNGFEQYEKEVGQLPGISYFPCREVLAYQLVESLRRTRYIAAITRRVPSAQCANPHSDMFDPEKAAFYFKNTGDIDEAFWLSFLSVHFGKNGKNGWKTLRAIYARDGQPGVWSWHEICSDVSAFQYWLDENKRKVNFGFGNHRKYESLDPYSPNGTVSVFRSYVDWVMKAGSHELLVRNAINKIGADPQDLFDYFYKDTSAIRRFGRLGKFDFLSLIGKLGLVNIVAGSMYLNGATGPKKGANLLFFGNKNENEGYRVLDMMGIKLNQYIKVGMQPLEDALCNWQKSPEIFKPFRG